MSNVVVTTCECPSDACPVPGHGSVPLTVEPVVLVAAGRRVSSDAPAAGCAECDPACLGCIGALLVEVDGRLLCRAHAEASQRPRR